MSGFFNVDNAFFTFMGKFWDLICLSVVWTVLSCYCLYILVVIEPPESLQSFGFILALLLQGITIGPATTALYYSVVKVIRRERNYALRSFFQSFKVNFKVSAITGELILIASYILMIDFQYARTEIANGGALGNVIYIGSLSLTIILVMMSVFIFPVLSRFTLNVFKLFKTTFFIAMRHIFTTIGLVIILGVFICGMILVPPSILVLPSVCCLAMSFLIERVFKKYMPVVMETTGEEDSKDPWYMGK